MGGIAFRAVHAVWKERPPPPTRHARNLRVPIRNSAKHPRVPTNSSLPGKEKKIGSINIGDLPDGFVKVRKSFLESILSFQSVSNVVVKFGI